MFCPTCGKDNSLELKFCASCGTNLEAVSQALSGREDDFFTKMDMGMDQFIARYSERVFKNAPQIAAERKVARSWKILGQAVITSFLDLLLFVLMWNLLPLRFLLLVISTPFRLMADRSESESRRAQLEPAYQPADLYEPPARLWLGEPVPSVTDTTTQHLGPSPPTGGRPPVTDRLK